MQRKLGNKTVQGLVPDTKPYEVRDTEVRGLVLRVQPSGVMTYMCDLRRPDGRRSRIKLGRADILSVAQARDGAKAILGEVAKGIDPIVRRSKDQSLNFGIFIKTKYAPWAANHLKLGSETVARILARFSAFEGHNLVELNAWKVEKWRAERMRDGASRATVNRNVTMLKAALSKAAEWGLLEANPLAGLKPLRTDSKAKVRYLTAEEERSLRSALDDREKRIRTDRRNANIWRSERDYDLLFDLDTTPFADHLKPMVLLSLNTGMRQGEVFQLKWEDVDLSKKVLTISGATAKSGQTRHIPMNEECREVLSSWAVQSGHKDGLVFPSRFGGTFNNVKKSWQGVLKSAGIVSFRWHDMRHHFASRLVMLGVDLNTVRALLGHSDLKMTLRYAHLAPSVMASAVARLDLRNPTAMEVQPA